MAERGELRIRFRAVGAAQLRAAIRGTATETRKAASDAKRSARETERERTKLAREGARVAVRAERDRAKAARAADAEIRRSAATLERERVRSQRAQERAQQRIRQARARDITRGNDRIGAVAGGAGAAGLATVIAGLTASLGALSDRLSSTADAIANQSGTTDVATRTARAQQFELDFERSGGEFFQDMDPAERTREMAALRAEIEAIGVATGQSPTDLLAGLTRMQTGFSQFEAGRANLRAIADEATRTGASFEDTAAFVGLLNQQLGENAPSADTAFNIMAQQGLDGSLTPTEYGRDFGGTIGAFGAQTGLSGEALLRQHGGLAQAMAAGGRGSAESATMLQSLMSDLDNEPTRRRLRRAGGGAAFREDGTVDYEAAQGIFANMDSRQLSGVFRNTESRMAAEQLGSLVRRERAGEDVATGIDLQNVDAGAGGAFRSENLARVERTQAMRARRAAVSGEVEGMNEGKTRGEEAQRLLDYREAMRRTGQAEWIGSMPGTENLQNLLGPSVLQAAGNVDPRTTAAMDAVGSTLSAGGFGGVGQIASGAAELTRVGNLQNRLGKEGQGGPRVSSTRVEGEVHLSQSTIAAIGESVARKIPRPSVPGRTPGVPGRG